MRHSAATDTVPVHVTAAPESDLDRFLPWELSGTYLESCNCDAICPCRRVGGVAGGRSTHGLCVGALSWIVQSGHAAARPVPSR